MRLTPPKVGLGSVRLNTIKDVRGAGRHRRAWGRPDRAVVASVSLPSVCREEAECDLVSCPKQITLHVIDMCVGLRAGREIEDGSKNAVVYAYARAWCSACGPAKILHPDGERDAQRRPS